MNVVMRMGLQSREWPWKHVNSLSSLFSLSEGWQDWNFGHTRAADYQRAGKSGSFKILEILIPLGSCFKSQPNAAPASACAFCQKSTDNVCAHPRLKISLQRVQLLKPASKAQFMHNRNSSLKDINKGSQRRNADLSVPSKCNRQQNFSTQLSSQD